MSVLDECGGCLPLSELRYRAWLREQPINRDHLDKSYRSSFNTTIRMPHAKWRRGLITPTALAPLGYVARGAIFRLPADSIKDWQRAAHPVVGFRNATRILKQPEGPRPLRAFHFYFFDSADNQKAPNQYRFIDSVIVPTGRPFIVIGKSLPQSEIRRLAELNADIGFVYAKPNWLVSAYRTQILPIPADEMCSPKVFSGLPRTVLQLPLEGDRRDVEEGLGPTERADWSVSID